MIIFFSVLFFTAAIGLIFSLNTRKAQLSRMANLLHMQFEPLRSNLTTEETSKRMEFFTRTFLHNFSNVFTFSDSRAFMRLADDQIRISEQDTAVTTLTVFSAELKKTIFPPLKITPKNSPFAKSAFPLVPTTLTQYALYTPHPQPEKILPAQILSFLKNHPNLYIEINDNAFIYHEHTLIAPENLQTFRLRAFQVLQELEHIPCAPQAKQTASTQKTDIGDQAQAMLTALTLSRPTTQPKSKNWFLVGIFILLAAIIGISLLAGNLIGRVGQ